MTYGSVYTAAMRERIHELSQGLGSVKQDLITNTTGLVTHNPNCAIGCIHHPVQTPLDKVLQDVAQAFNDARENEEYFI